MTSSLVGSEMCIRDRSAAGPDTKDCPRRGVGLDSWASVNLIHTNDDPKDCLLYTSDAADDM
eukprot:4735649-Prorocentrum_lima.AAC.1